MALRRPYVCRIRVANLNDKDFIEIEYPEDKLNYHDLLETFCRELGVDKIDVEKIRKLPDTKVRTDEDCKRFNRLEHFELVIIPSRMQPKYDYQL